MLGTVASVVGIGSGLNSIFGGGSSGPQPSSGTTAGGTVYDPFAQYRQQFGSQLAGMMTPGASFNTSDPSYAFRFGQGAEAVNRSEGAKGMLGSGNRLMDLVSYGQGMGSTEYGAQFNRLASLAGTSQTMGTSMGSLQNQQQQGGWNALAQGMSSLANTWGSWGGGGGGSTDMSGFQTNPYGPATSAYGSSFDVGMGW